MLSSFFPKKAQNYNQPGEAMNAELVMLENGEVVRKIPIPARGKIMIGRIDVCEIILDDINISRIHSLVIFSPKGSIIVDLGSSSGTFVNDRRVEKSALFFGDEIRIGNFIFKFMRAQKDIPVNEESSVVDDGRRPTQTSPNMPIGISADSTLRVKVEEKTKVGGGTCKRCETKVSEEDIAEGKGVCYKNRYFCERHLPLEQGTPSQIAQYKLLMPLGGGSVSNVYKAKHLFIQTIIALKLMRSKYASYPSVIERFFREARFGVRFDHPNIVRIYDAGKQDDSYYLIMEYFNGTTLYELAMQNPIPVALVLQIARQLCDAVAYAHSWGVVHRDIKPSNILINETGEIKLTDLGAAKQWENPHESGLTQKGQFIGTLRYQPPEQIANASEVDQRADVYAIGACLYYCLSGQPPFQGTSLAELLDSVLGGYYIPIKEVIPDIPPPLEEMITRSLQREAKERPQNMAEMQAYLNEL